MRTYCGEEKFVGRLKGTRFRPRKSNRKRRTAKPRSFEAPSLADERDTWDCRILIRLAFSAAMKGGCLSGSLTGSLVGCIETCKSRRAIIDPTMPRELFRDSRGWYRGVEHGSSSTNGPHRNWSTYYLLPTNYLLVRTRLWYLLLCQVCVDELPTAYTQNLQNVCDYVLLTKCTYTNICIYSAPRQIGVCVFQSGLLHDALVFRFEIFSIIHGETYMLILYMIQLNK